MAADDGALRTSSRHGLALDGDAERHLLSACLGGGRDAVDEAIHAGVSVADFGNERLGLVFAAMGELAEEEAHIDLVSVVERIMLRGNLDAVGGSAPVAQLHALMIPPVAISRRARTVADGAAYRRISEASQIINTEALSRSTPAAELAVQAQEVFASIDEAATRKDEPVDNLTVLDEIFASIGKRLEGSVPTGFPDLDDMMGGGLVPGTMTIIAGRPGQGKTALALSIASHVAGMGVPVLYLSLEMPARSLLVRVTAAQASVVSNPQQWGRLSRDEASRLAEARAVVSDMPLRIVDTPGPTIAQACAMARRMRSREGIGLVIVDHIGKIKPSDRYAGSPTHEVAEVSEALRALGGRLGIPVLALSQLNRGTEARNDKHPSLGDLRDSGTLEQDAHAVIFPYRPEYYLKDKCPEAMRGLCEIDVAKNRDGPVGTINVGFDARTSRFSPTFDRG